MKSIIISFVNKGLEQKNSFDSRIDNNLLTNHVKKINTLDSWLVVQINKKIDSNIVEITIED